MEDKDYLSCATTAKLVRQALKREFPGVKFSVRSHVYSGGASINVGWTDGPTSKTVEAIAEQFAGGGFDGSIDLKYDVEHYLLPDGSTVIAHSPGTAGSLGAYPAIEGPGSEFAEITGARRVSFGADYVFCERDLSDKAANIIRNAAHDAYGHEWLDGRWAPTDGMHKYSQEVTFS